MRLPARSPNLNAFAERWVKSVKDECLSKLMLFTALYSAKFFCNIGKSYRVKPRRKPIIQTSSRFGLLAGLISSCKSGVTKKFSVRCSL